MADDGAAIEAVVKIYLDGLHEGDADSLPRCSIRRAR